MAKRIIKSGLMVVIVVLLVSSIALVGCAKPAPEVQQMEVLGAPMGGTGMTVATAVADILTKYCPGVEATATETGGGIANMVEAEKRDPNTALFHNTDTDYPKALAGMPPFKKKYTEVRWIAGWVESGWCFGTLDPNIKTPKDMGGKTVGLPPKPWGSSTIFLDLFKLWGIDDKVTVKHMAFGPLAAALKDGTVDVIAASAKIAPGSWIPLPFCADIIAVKKEKFRAIGIDEESLGKAFERTGLHLRVGVMPAGSLGPGHTEPAGVFTMLNTGLCCYSGADKGLIYKITKTLTEESPRFKEYFAWGTVITSKGMVETMPIKSEDEIHPGALKYYKEAKLIK